MMAVMLVLGAIVSAPMQNADQGIAPAVLLLLHHKAVSRERVLSELRGKGITHLGQVERVYMEASGGFTTVGRRTAGAHRAPVVRRRAAVAPAKARRRDAVRELWRATRGRRSATLSALSFLCAHSGGEQPTVKSHCSGLPLEATFLV